MLKYNTVVFVERTWRTWPAAVCTRLHGPEPAEKTTNSTTRRCAATSNWKQRNKFLTKKLFSCFLRGVIYCVYLMQAEYTFSARTFPLMRLFPCNMFR